MSTKKYEWSYHETARLQWVFIVVAAFGPGLVHCAASSTPAEVRTTTPTAHKVSSPTENKSGAQQECGPFESYGFSTIPSTIRQRMNPYLNVRSASFMDWDEAGSGMLVLMRTGATEQAHHVASPGSARTQLTFYSESLQDASYLRGSMDSALLLRFDPEGNKRDQLYRLDLLEGRSIPLTRSGSRVYKTVWGTKRYVAYSSNERNGTDFDLYLLDLDGENAIKRLTSEPGLWIPLSFSSDNSKLLALHFNTQGKSILLSFDLATGGGEKQILFDHLNLSPTTTAHWAADHQSVYLLSDHENEYATIYYYAPGRKQLAKVLPSIEHDVEGFDLSPDGSSLAFVVNEEGLSQLKLFSLAKKRVQTIEHPQGVIRRVAFSHDAKELRLGFSVQSSTGAEDVYSYHLKQRKLERWTTSELGGLNADFFVKPESIRFPSKDQVDGKPRQLPAFYYKPPGDGPHPVMIYLDSDVASQFRPIFRPEIQYWVMEMGVAVLAPNVRGSRGYGRSYRDLDNGEHRGDAIDDLGALIAWIGTQPQFDAKRVVVVGRYYGGYLTLASLAQFADKLKAGVSWSGYFDWITYLASTSDGETIFRREEFGNDQEVALRKRLEALSPLSFANRIASPLLLIHGANDLHVPKSDADEFAEGLQAANRSVTYLSARQEGHRFRRKESVDVAQMAIVAFLHEQLGIPLK